MFLEQNIWESDTSCDIGFHRLQILLKAQWCVHFFSFLFFFVEIFFFASEVLLLMKCSFIISANLSEMWFDTIGRDISGRLVFVVGWKSVCDTAVLNARSISSNAAGSFVWTRWCNSLCRNSIQLLHFSGLYSRHCWGCMFHFTVGWCYSILIKGGWDSLFELRISPISYTYLIYWSTGHHAEHHAELCSPFKLQVIISWLLTY